MHILKLNQACINIDFIEHIFESYRKGVDYMSQPLDMENKLTKQLIFLSLFVRSIFKKFNVEADVLVSKKKKIVHIAFKRALIFYYFFHELINFVEHYWNKQKYVFRGYQFTYPRLNQSLKWKNNYIFFEKR